MPVNLEAPDVHQVAKSWLKVLQDLSTNGEVTDEPACLRVRRGDLGEESGQEELAGDEVMCGSGRDEGFSSVGRVGTWKRPEVGRQPSLCSDQVAGVETRYVEVPARQARFERDLEVQIDRQVLRR